MSIAPFFARGGIFIQHRSLQNGTLNNFTERGDLRVKCTITDLRSKEVINVDNGCRLGCVTDVEIDTCTGCLVSITVFCGRGVFGFCGRGEEIVVCWKDIVVIGDDTILVRKGGTKLP